MAALPTRRRPPRAALAALLAAALASASCGGAGAGGEGAGARGGWTLQTGLNQAFAAARGAGAGDWPASSAGAYLVGRFALDQGDVTTAAQQFEQALKADPGNAELVRQVFVLNVANGRFDAAAAGGLAGRDPAADEARLLLAVHAAREGDFREARLQAQGVQPRGVGATVAPLVAAWASVGEGEPGAAVARLDAERREDGFATLRAYHLALLHLRAGDAARAEALLAPVVPADEAAPARLVVTRAAALALVGDAAGARDLVARQLAFAEGHPLLEGAAEALAAGRAPTVPVGDPRAGMADALLSLAAALQEQGLSAQAIVYGRLATHADPSTGEAWLVVARALAGQGNPEGAAAVLEQVPPGSPFRWNARLARAEALAELERFDDAAAELRAMAAERPARVEPLVALADMLRGEERYAEAEAAYGLALARLPELRRQHWRLLYARGIALERTKRWPEAEAALARALELEPEQPFVLNYLGYSWVDQGLQLEKAEAMLRRAVELRPEDGFIVDSLGWAFFRLGRFPEAVERLERAVELQAGDPVINDHLGDAYWRVGREREARYQWRRALTLEPEPETVAGIERKVQEGLGRAAAPPAPGRPSPG